MKKVGVVILNYKLRDLTLRCLKSVFESEYKNKNVYVIDNDSKDGLIEEQKNFPKANFIQNKENLGYAGGNNVGIRQALKDNCELVFIINPDVLIEKKTIEILSQSIEHNAAGIVGPKIYFLENEKKLDLNRKIWFAGGLFNTANVLGSHQGVNESDHGQYEETKLTDYVTGASIMVTRQVFEKIGLFDEDYFLYYEDSDFCFRAKKAGFKIMYIPQAVSYHENAKATGLGSPLQDYYITRNRMLFARKFLPFRTQFALIREAIRNLGIKPRRQALFDFLSNKLGGQEIYG